MQRMPGHRDPRRTQRYADVTEEMVRAALRERRRRCGKEQLPEKAQSQHAYARSQEGKTYG
ncbi:MAG: hypothetical protein MI924_17680 [Chloroflexales bacterium]|nr:hypothetical protein [Chloroflexales bacterium]